MPLLDLFQEGCIGLTKAVDNLTIQRDLNSQPMPHGGYDKVLFVQ